MDSEFYRGQFALDEAACFAKVEKRMELPFTPSLFAGYRHENTLDTGSAVAKSNVYDRGFLSMIGIPKITGLELKPNWITAADAEQLVGFVDNQIWNTTLKRRVQQYGYRYDYGKRSLGCAFSNVDAKRVFGPVRAFGARARRRSHVQSDNCERISARSEAFQLTLTCHRFWANDCFSCPY